MGRQRIHLRLSSKNMTRLEQLTASPGVTKSAIVDAALTAYFNPEQTEIQEAALLRRLDQFDLKQGAIERDTAILMETVGQFVLYWLTMTEPLADGERDVAHALGQKRFEYFINQVAQKLGTDRAMAARLFPDFDDSTGSDAEERE